MYQFAKIEKMDDILPMIKDKEEFYVADKDGYKVINYHVNFADTFPDVVDHTTAIFRECRGIIFDENGNLIRRPLHKFFNLNEKTECNLDNVDFSKPHYILDKLDGSMISPFFVNSKLIWGTKMGETFLSPLVEQFITNNPQYEEFSVHWIENGYTPVFEFCTNQNRIVLPYANDRLVLLAIRNNLSGEYIEYEYMKKLCYDSNIECVGALEISNAFNNTLLDQIRAMENIEGFVIRFLDGHMIKVKCDWYCLLHKTKDYLTRERYLTDIIIQDRSDDLSPILFGETKEHFSEFQESILQCIQTKAKFIKAVVEDCQINNVTAKDFALNHSKKFESWVNPFVFKNLSNTVTIETSLDYIKERILNNVRKDKDYDIIKKTLLKETKDWQSIISTEG